MSPPEFTPTRFDVIHTAPAWMPEYERVVLYALVVGLRPTRVLEIGTFQGGSTLVMTAALDDNGGGEIVCVDPDPRLAPETSEAVKHRAKIVAEASPDALAEAMKIAGGSFEFALIDGDHSRAGVVRDIEATLPTLADEAHLLFHDAHFGEVRDAIDDAITRHPGVLIDAGVISRGHTTDENGVSWGGLRLLRYHRQSQTAAGVQDDAPAVTPQPVNGLQGLRRRIGRALRGTPER